MQSAAKKTTLLLFWPAIAALAPLSEAWGSLTAPWICEQNPGAPLYSAVIRPRTEAFNGQAGVDSAGHNLIINSAGGGINQASQIVAGNTAALSTSITPKRKPSSPQLRKRVHIILRKPLRQDETLPIALP